MKVCTAFSNFKNKNPDYNFELLNGGFEDIDGANTTPVEIGLYDLNYINFSFENKKIKKIECVKKEKYCKFETKFENRMVSILVTSSKKLLKDKILIRNNEIMLNNYSLLLSQALLLIKLGYSEIESWSIVLDLEKPYNKSFILESNKLENKAQSKCDYLNKIILKSNKKVPDF